MQLTYGEVRYSRGVFGSRFRNPYRLLGLLIHFFFAIEETWIAL